MGARFSKFGLLCKTQFTSDITSKIRIVVKKIIGEYILRKLNIRRKMRNLNSLTAEIVEGGVVLWFDIAMIVHETGKACSQTSVLCIANTKDSSRAIPKAQKAQSF